ncbi:hypothetical protein V1289_005747 [Bradyrhizobium sp. AZCC 2289]
MGHFLILAGALANCVCRPIRPDQLQPSGRKRSLPVGKLAAARTVSSVDRYEARNVAIVGATEVRRKNCSVVSLIVSIPFFGVSPSSMGHTSISTNGTRGALLSLLRPMIRARGINMIMLKCQNHYEGASSWESTSADLRDFYNEGTSPTLCLTGCLDRPRRRIWFSLVPSRRPCCLAASRTGVSAHWRSL